jgi:hypothetical protein
MLTMLITLMPYWPMTTAWFETIDPACSHLPPLILGPWVLCFKALSKDTKTLQTFCLAYVQSPPWGYVIPSTVAIPFSGSVDLLLNSLLALLSTVLIPSTVISYCNMAIDSSER